MATDTTIVRASVFPPIGIARIGNSRAAGTDGYFVGPEVPDAPVLPLGHYKSASGFLKRQAACFRIYGFNAAGEVVAELNASNASVKWKAHLVNAKAAWYQFQQALDIPEAASPTAPPSRRRNMLVTGEDRRALVIDPGLRTIEGRGTEGGAYAFTGGKFLGLDVPLGELRTDSEGRLLVLGGFGLSQSIVNQPPQEFANNDGWHDDTSDGPVDAEVTVEGKSIPVQGAWVVVAPPNYAPALKTVRTLYDALYDRMIEWALLPAPAKVSFQRHIRPIFERLSGLQWVNKGFAAWFGADSPNEFAHLVTRLADPSPGNQDFRQKILDQFRNPGAKHLGKNLWAPFYGDGLDSLEGSPGPDATLNFSDSLASLSKTQLAWLGRWAAGDFLSDPAPAPLEAVDDAPLAERPGLLTEAALSYCLADAFHPGCEFTWPMRQRWLYDDHFRIRRRPSGDVEPDWGEVLTPAVATSPMGPLNGVGPGGLTRWMAVPWQTDTASCLSGYTFFNISPGLPTFWPARVPNQVLTDASYSILMDPKNQEAKRRAAFTQRDDWFRSFDPRIMTTQMITEFGKLGIVEERPGPADLPGVPSKVWVETGLDLPPLVPPASGGEASQEGPTRHSLRKFGRNRRSSRGLRPGGLPDERCFRLGRGRRPGRRSGGASRRADRCESFTARKSFRARVEDR